MENMPSLLLNGGRAILAVCIYLVVVKVYDTDTVINGRRRKNFIQHLETPGGLLVIKSSLSCTIFTSLFAFPPERSQTLNWDTIALQSTDLSHLEKPFDEEEVKTVIIQMHSEKAPGPDGFIGLFFESAWNTLKFDLLEAVNSFFLLRDHQFKFLNSAHIVLLPKTVDAKRISDFHPISLTHSIAKIISKLLANRLAPHLDQIMSRSQSAFIRKRSIHDNFLYTQNVIKELHRSSTSALFLKLDIAKAFDSWVDEGRQWVGTDPPCDDTDAALFRASTIVIVGNGRKTNFWADSWLQGKAPMDIAPSLFQLAWRKKNKVSEELINLNWTRGLWRMNSVQQMADFIKLWDLVQAVYLSDAEDTIRWKWTADGVYSSKSAYLVQFNGFVRSSNAKFIWRAHAEGKHKFFGWLLAQAKILTADKLLERQWPSSVVTPRYSFEVKAKMGLYYIRNDYSV
ncbi:hypothetical protein U9M48_012153 [Paspalum notatum var. saurae]|uniref:Reverse transcriptase domain-containing protein n=1 Tax=Paspalum notatum var. saurae TaxID=547442 RepID=A0AAQ3WI25_PASNO